MPDKPGTVDFETLQTELAGVGTAVEELKTASDEAGAKLQADIDTRMLATEKVVNDLKESLEKRSLSLDGANQEVHHGRKATLGSCIFAVQCARENGMKAARSVYGLEFDIFDATAKANDVETEMYERALSTEVDTGAGWAVPEQIAAGFTEKFYDGTVLADLGARFITDVGGRPYRGIKVRTGATAAYVAEGAAPAAATQLALGRVNFEPRKLRATTAMTEEQVTDGSPGLMTAAEDDLRLVMQLAMELKSIEGDGGEVEPSGLINNPDILTYDATAIPNTATNGRDIDDYAMKRLRMQVEENNALRGGNISEGYLMRTTVKNHLALHFQLAGGGTTSGVPDDFPHVRNLFRAGIITQAELDALYGKVAHTMQLAANLTVGGSSNGTRVIFGNWRDFWVPIWGGVMLSATDTATHNSVSAWDSEQRFIKAVMRHDAGAIRGGSFVLATGFRSAPTGV